MCCVLLPSYVTLLTFDSIRNAQTEDELWTHFPLYHVYDANITAKCPVCHKTKDNFAVHIREHGPAARGEVHSESRPRIQLYAFSLVRC